METIRKIATRGAQSRSITDVDSFEKGSSPRMRLIILDEADNLFERGSEIGDSDVSDKGGKRAIIELLSTTRQPVILIVNDYYALTRGSGKALVSLCERIKFRRLGPASIARRLREILEMEGIGYDERAVQDLAQRSAGDMRSAVGDLQIACTGRDRLTVKDLETVGLRDNRDNIFRILERLLGAGTINDHRKAIFESDESPDSLILWLEENLTSVMSHPEDLDRAYRLISKADIYLGRVRRRQNYRLWSYANDMMASVYLAKKHKATGRTPFSFPSYLKSMSRTKESRALMKEASTLIGNFTHVSSAYIRDETIYRLGTIVKRDPEFGGFLVADIGLNKSHLKLMTLGDLTNSDYRKIAKSAEEIRESAAKPVFLQSVDEFPFTDEEVPDEAEEEVEEEAKEEETEPKQLKLFEF